MTSTRIINGDSRVELAALPECSVDAVVTDPPYELGFTSRRDDTLGALEELRTWVLGQMVDAQHGKHVEDAGRASAYARIAVRITEMQRRGS
jgi:DNA modification methylase